MKNRFRQLCAVVTVIALLLSSLPILSAHAQQTSAETYNRTGDLGIYEEDSETPVITSAEDYYRYAGAPKTDKNIRTRATASGIPQSVDNSQSPYFPAIGNQGALGACVVFATTYYQFTYTMNKARGVNTTADNTFSVKWIYNLVSNGSDNGSSAYTIYKVLKQNGCPTAKTLPYDGVDFTSWSTDEKVWREAMRYRLKDSQMFKNLGENGYEITSNDDEDLIPIKTALNNGDILKFSSYIYSWEYDNLKINSNTPENTKYNNEKIVSHLSGAEGGHGMVIVGYNDNIWCDINGNDAVDTGEMGAFKIANSWGSSYGNKGFMWIAYDALNKVSCVEGVEHIEARYPAIEDVYRIDVCNSEEGNDLYLKFTLNTADRTQFSVSVDADKNGSEYKGYFLSGAGYNTPSNRIAFDGTKNPCDATFVYPLKDLDPEISAENFEQYNFNVTIKDGNSDSIPLTVKNITLVNEHTNSEYKVNASYPITLNGSQYTANIKNSTKKNAVVYYIGYDSPTLHYKTQGSTYKAVKMQENSEKLGALYKYVIYDITGDVSLYFSDNNGNTDNNQGYYYTAKEGLNFYYTKNQREPLTVHDFTLSNGIPDVGKRCLFDTDVTGGYETYSYKYTIENLDTNEVKEYDFDYNYDISPYSFTKEGTYRITIEVMDYAKETAKLTKNIQVTDQPFQIESVTMDKNSAIVSKNVQFSSTTAFEGIASYGGYTAKSRFVIKDSSGKVWCDEIVKYSTYDIKIKTTTTNYNFVPQKSGEYSLTVSSEDCNKEYAEKTIAFTVHDMVVGDADGSGNIDIRDATTIQMFVAKMSQDLLIYEDMADGDGSGLLNIRDATAIQCYIAKFGGSGQVGNVIEYIPPTEPTTEPVTEPKTEPTTPVSNNTVTFTNSFNWGGTISCYYWSDANTAMTTWPGKAMTLIGVNEFGQSLYTFEVPKDADYIIFTNGSSQTTNITYSGGAVRYYPLSQTDSSGHNLVQTW